MTTSTIAPPGPVPQLVWKRLARLVAAPGRSRMRLWDPATGKFTDTVKRTDGVPTRPAAVYLYTKGRTRLLALDFDAKHHGAAAVEADLATAAAWITGCGGAIVTDRSTSGGRHLLCPLAIGTTASVDEMTHLLRLLAARLPTLDITPNTNAETGCITPPGSPCREGGYRHLDGSLDTAVEAFTTRSASDLLPRLYMLLGALKPAPRQLAMRSSATDELLEQYTEGVGDDRRIAPAHVRADPLPAEVSDFATCGVRSPNRPTWQSNHQARQSVVVQAIARGHSLASLRALIAPGAPWAGGLGHAYDRYRHGGDQALTRDVGKAFTWLVTNAIDSSPPRHKTKYTQGGTGALGPLSLRDWLSNALAWADREYTGKRYRWTVHALFQAIAFAALVAGEQRSGTWLVGVGGRALSLGCGLLSEDTVWRVLTDVRDRPGSPLLLVRPHVGTEPDVYALTTQNRVSTDPARAERVRIEPVHDAWIVLGHHLRRIYELVCQHGLTNKPDIYAAAAVPRATGDAMVIDLEIAGLLKRTGRGTVAPGPVNLDAIAEQHRLLEQRTERIERHRAERAAWRDWLTERERQRDAQTPTVLTAGDHTFVVETPISTTPTSEHTAWLDSVMTTGPPALDDYDIEHRAIEIIAEVLGGHIVTAT